MRTCASLANSLSLAGAQAGAGQGAKEEGEGEGEEEEAGAARRSLAHWRPLLATLLQNTFLISQLQNTFSSVSYRIHFQKSGT